MKPEILSQLLEIEATAIMMQEVSALATAEINQTSAQWMSDTIEKIVQTHSSDSVKAYFASIAPAVKIESVSATVKATPASIAPLTRMLSHVIKEITKENASIDRALIAYNQSQLRGLSDHHSSESKLAAAHTIGEVKSAIIKFKESLAKEPGHFSVLIQLGEAYLVLGLNNLAYQCFMLAYPRAKSPEENILSMNGMGWAQLKSSNYSVAIDLFHKALKLKCPDAFTMKSLGAAYLKLGDYPMAGNYLRTSRHIQPDFYTQKLFDQTMLLSSMAKIEDQRLKRALNPHSTFFRKPEITSPVPTSNTSPSL